MNYESQPLRRHEAEAMKADDAIRERVLRSYCLMLDFYGMRLEDSETGFFTRSDKNYKDRYRNLARECHVASTCGHGERRLAGSSHNNLRISRILKCLSILDLERLNAGFLLFVLAEQSEHGELNTPAIRSSMDRW